MQRGDWKSGLVLMALAVAAPLQAASAQDATRSGFYAQLGLGALVLQDNDYSSPAGRVSGSYDVGPYGTLALGYRISPNLRVEAELGAATANYSPSGSAGDDRFGLFSGFLGGYLDLPVSTAAIPYVGFGLGLATSSARDLGSNGGFAAFGEIGVSIPLGTQFDLVPAVRYTWFDTSDGLSEADAGLLPRLAVRFHF